MFQNQNTNKSTEVDIENLPVRTMKQDLEEINNPSAKQPDALEYVEKPKPKITVENMTAAQKSSPFLAPEPQTQRAPEPIKVFPKAPQPAAPKAQAFEASKPVRLETTQAAPKEPAIQISPEKSRSSKKAAVLAFAVLIILILAGGGYYFWNISQQNAQNTANNTPAIPAPEPIAIEPAPEPPAPAPIFSIDKPNYMPLDLSGTKEALTAKIFNEYAGKITQGNIMTPVEFIVTDPQNNPIAFSAFADKLGISFSKNVASLVGNKFSLFIYNIGNNEARIGLAIETTNAAALKTAMRKEESNIIKEMTPLIPITFTLSGADKTFSTANYNNTEIRFLNIINPAVLSVDYAISGSKLVIGTTKMTIRAILDYAASHPTNTAQPVSAPATTAPVSPIVPSVNPVPAQ